MLLAHLTDLLARDGVETVGNVCDLVDVAAYCPDVTAQRNRVERDHDLLDMPPHEQLTRPVGEALVPSVRVHFPEFAPQFLGFLPLFRREGDGFADAASAVLRPAHGWLAMGLGSPERQAPRSGAGASVATDAMPATPKKHTFLGWFFEGDFSVVVGSFSGIA